MLTDFIRKSIFDRDVLAAMLFRVWSLAAGGGTVILISLYLDPIEQGYYYTFASILALQVFFELGMGQVVIQIAAHEAVHIRLDISGRYIGPCERMGRIAKFKTHLFRWYAIISILFLLCVASAGLLFFPAGKLAWQQWALPWLFLVGATSVNLFLSWKLAMVEGFGHVFAINRLRLKQSIIGYALMWVGLTNDGGLWVVWIVPATATFATVCWLLSEPARGIMFIQSTAHDSAPIRWRHDIFPFQWRIALSWISSYFLYSMFTPLAFSYQGAEEAGKLGLALTIFSAISTVGMSWASAKAPRFSMLIAENNSPSLKSLFKAVAISSVLTTTSLAGFVLLGAWISTIYNVPFMQRVASLPVLVCLGLATIANTAIFCAATFMRAHKEEPLVAMSFTSAALAACIAWVSVPYGTSIMMLNYCLVTLFVGLPWTIILLKKYLSRHHLK